MSKKKRRPPAVWHGHVQMARHGFKSDQTMQETTQAQHNENAHGPLKVTLLKQHSHAGFDHEADEEIEVTRAQADWLKALGVI